MRRIPMLTAILALALTACGQGSVPQTPAASAPGVSAAPQPAASQPAPELETPPAASASTGRQTALVVMVEGVEEEIPATLYTGDGWSLCVPETGWTAADVDREDREVTWESLDNREVEFGVQAYPGRTASEAFQRFCGDEDDYSFPALTDGGSIGYDSRDQETMAVRIVEAAGGAYLFWGEYPDVAAEGFGARLQAIGNSLTAD